MNLQKKEQIVQMDTAVIEQFDDLVASCVTAMSETHYSIMHSMTLLTGIKELKKFFNDPQIKDLVESAKGSEAGFLTDERPANPNKRAVQYTYSQVIEALIPRILEGYRITGNEINIISGKGMAVKRGKFRKIIEMTDSFAPTIGSPQQKNNQSTFRCTAKWTKDGKNYSIGISENDPCLITMKSGSQYDSIDKMIGLAESKLYTRVLTRLTGNFMDEEGTSTTTVDITQEAEESKNAEIINLKKVSKDPVDDNPFQQKKEQSPIEHIPHPKTSLLEKYFADEDYVEVFDMLEETGTVTRQKVKAVILDDDAKEALSILKAIDKITRQ